MFLLILNGEKRLWFVVTWSPINMLTAFFASMFPFIIILRWLFEVLSLFVGLASNVQKFQAIRGSLLVNNSIMKNR